MTVKTYEKEAPNSKALNQLGEWLNAVKVQVEPSSTPGCDLVATSGEKKIEIKVGSTALDDRPAVEHLFLLSSQVTHRVKEISIRQFHRITEALDLGTPLPIDRGEDPSRKLHFEGNFELVAMRHKEFRKVGNPDPEELVKYSPVIKKAVSRAVYINAKIFKRHGIEFEDLMTYAQIWTCNYLGLYKVRKPTNNDNERKLYAHLCQRALNFIEVLLKKERNCIPDVSTASIALFGMPFEDSSTRTANRLYNDDFGLSSPSSEDAFEEATGLEEASAAELYSPDAETLMTADYNPADHKVIDDKAQAKLEAKRRRLAQKALAQELSKLPHEVMIAKLEEARDNTHLCFDARSEARKQLRIHRSSCTCCVSDDVQEQAGAVDSLG